MRVTETQRDCAELLPGALVLIAGEILIQQLQRMRHHPDARTFRAGQRRAIRREAGNQQPGVVMHKLLFGHGNPAADQG